MFPLVSIIIPLYNHQQFIEKCLDSILEDSYPNKEIVIIDDGSRDESATVVRAWRDTHSSTLQHCFTFVTRENRGLTRTLNELVGLAKGDLIAVLASDDYLLPGGIGARVSYLENNPDKFAVFGDCVLVDYNGAVSEKSGLSDLYDGRKSHLRDARLIAYEIVFNWCVPGPVFMARKEIYSLIGGYNENIAVEDWDFYLRIAARDLLGFIDQPVAAYRLRPEGADANHTDQQRIRFDEAMRQTVTNNFAAFTGIKRCYLYFEKIKYYGILERLHGRNSLKAFLARKTGRIMVVVLKACYGLRTRIIMSTSQNR
jgi:glycosyltransferase involved in cell wall biosynthesis